MTEQTKQPDDQQPALPPVATDTSLRIDNLVMGVKAQFSEEQKDG